MPLFKDKNAFTLAEVITVVIIISIVAAFAIPNFQNSVARAHEKDMVANLRAIAAANQIFFSETGAFWPPPDWPALHNVTEINSNLRLGIIENQTQYFCFNLPAMQVACEVRTLSSPQWRVRIEDTSGWQPFCSAGTCPTCDGAGCPN